MRKNSTVATKRKKIFNEKKLTIGMDLRDRYTYYCVLDEAGEVVVEQKMATTKQGIQQVFSRMPRSRVAMETGAQNHILKGDFSRGIEMQERSKNSRNEFR